MSPLFVLSACAGGGQSQSTVPTAPVADSLPTQAATSPATTDLGNPPPSDAVVTAPTTPPTTVVDPDLVIPAGLDMEAARVTTADGTVCDLCLWIADTVDLRNRGLMFVDSLGPADGMGFVYPDLVTTRFWMKDTVLPLSIAFYGVDGAFVDSFDMDPCTADDSADCPRYPTPPDFVVAVETYQGGLEALDMTPGSTLELLDLPCAT